MSFQSNTVQEFVTGVYFLPYRSFIRQSRRQIIGLCHARNAPFPRWRTHCMSERIIKPTDELNLLMQFFGQNRKKTQERNFLLFTVRLWYWCIIRFRSDNLFMVVCDNIFPAFKGGFFLYSWNIFWVNHFYLKQQIHENSRKVNLNGFISSWKFLIEFQVIVKIVYTTFGRAEGDKALVLFRVVLVSHTECCLHTYCNLLVVTICAWMIACFPIFMTFKGQCIFIVKLYLYIIVVKRTGNLSQHIKHWYGTDYILQSYNTVFLLNCQISCYLSNF